MMVGRYIDEWASGLIKNMATLIGGMLPVSETVTENENNTLRSKIDARDTHTTLKLQDRTVTGPS